MNSRFTPWIQAEAVHYASRHTLRQPRFRYLSFSPAGRGKVDRRFMLSHFWGFESVPF